MEWIKLGKTVNADGTTIMYELPGTTITIESRKRHIPHASGVGTWDHTTYWVLDGGVEVKERFSLSDAKGYGEALFAVKNKEA